MSTPSSPFNPLPPETAVYDLAIIGGGIAGAAIADEAASQGMAVLLVEKNTFGSGTSSKSSKLIHGGLRYLEVAWDALFCFDLIEFWKNMRFVFLALRETHILAKRWPNLIFDIELLMPIYKNHGRSKLAIQFGAWIYGLLSRLGGAKKSPRFFSSAEEVLSIEPGLNPTGLLGGVLIHDHTTNDLKLVRAIILTAKGKGVQAFEHTCVTSYRWDSSKKQFEINTEQNGVKKDFRARKLINASGPWVDLVRESAGTAKSQLLTPVAGAHIEVPVFSNYSVVLQAEDGRIFFVINRQGRARIGTTERKVDVPEKINATDEEIHYLQTGVRWFFPNLPNDTNTLIRTDAGIRPLARPAHETDASKISREHAFVKDSDGVIHVLGVKLTDHRRAAEELFKKFFSRSKLCQASKKTAKAD